MEFIKLRYQSLLLFGMIFLIGSGLAWGYILPARFYLRKMLRTRSSMRRLKVWMKTTLYKDGKKLKDFEERLFVRKPGDIRLERWQRNKMVKLNIWRQRTAFEWDGKGALKSLKRRVEPRFDFFAVGAGGLGYGRLSHVLRRLKVHYRGHRMWDRESDYRLQTSVSLGWAQKGPAVVIGAPSGDRKRNQIWLDKEHWHLVRFIGQLEKKGIFVDIHFLDYFTSTRGRIYPGRVRIYKNKKLVLQSILYRIKVNPSISDRLFSHIH